MKWIKVLDINRVPPTGDTMRRHLYDALVDEARSCPNHTITSINLIEARMLEKKRTGVLRTVTSVWPECLRYHFSWLKEKGYIESDRPYKPRPWQREDGYNSMAYAFLDKPPTKSARPMIELWERFRGQVWEKLSLRTLLMKEEHAGRTKWDYFKDNKNNLILHGSMQTVRLDREDRIKYRKIHGITYWEERYHTPSVGSYRYKPVAVEFREAYDDVGWWTQLPSDGVLPEIFSKYAGKRIEEWQLYVDLVAARSPNGTTDLWAVLRHYRVRLERNDLIRRITTPHDHIIHMHAMIKIKEARRNALKLLAEKQKQEKK